MPARETAGAKPGSKDVVTQALLDERVGLVEREQARQGEKLSRIESDVGRIGAGVEKLLEREIKRPSAMTWQAIATAAGGLATIMIVVWWLIEHSPSVQTLERRVTDLDHEKRGRVTMVERKIETLEGWKPTSVRRSP